MVKVSSKCSSWWGTLLQLRPQKTFDVMNNFCGWDRVFQTDNGTMGILFKRSPLVQTCLWKSASDVTLLNGPVKYLIRAELFQQQFLAMVTETACVGKI